MTEQQKGAVQLFKEWQAVINTGGWNSGEAMEEALKRCGIDPWEADRQDLSPFYLTIGSTKVSEAREGLVKIVNADGEATEIEAKKVEQALKRLFKKEF